MKLETLYLSSRPLMWLSVLLLSWVWLSSCGGTEGKGDVFKVQPSTNQDFAAPIFVEVGRRPSAMVQQGNKLLVLNQLNEQFKYQSTLTLLTPSGATYTKQAINVDAGIEHTLSSQLFWKDLNGSAPHDAVVIIPTKTSSVAWICMDMAAACGSTVKLTFAGVPADVKIHDVDGDGDLDVAALLAGKKQIELWLNNGTGAFGSSSQKIALTKNGFQLEFGDFDGSATPDDAVVLNTDYSFSVLLRDATKTLVGYKTPIASYLAGTGASFLWAGQLDSTHHHDVVVSNYTSDSISTALSKADGTFQIKTHKIGEQPFRLVVGAFKTGGAKQIVVGHSQRLYASWVELNASGALGNTRLITTTRNPIDLAAGNFNGSGLDVAVIETKQRVIGILSGDGNGGFIRTQLGFDAAPQYLLVGALGGTASEDDIAFLQPYQNRVVILLSK